MGKCLPASPAEKHSNSISNALFPHLIGGAADLSPSTETYMKDYTAFEANDPGGRNFHFGIREHSMGAICNGIALTPGMIPFGATFLIFSDYMRPPIRLAAIMKIRPVIVYTHDSIGLGEDGTTHQPIEQLANSLGRSPSTSPSSVRQTPTRRHHLGAGKSPSGIPTRPRAPCADKTEYPDHRPR